MQTRHVAIAAVLAVAFAMQVFTFLGANAGVRTSADNDRLNILQMMIDPPLKSLPFHDVENFI
jgi:hypothetical protein